MNLKNKILIIAISSSINSIISATQNTPNTNYSENNYIQDSIKNINSETETLEKILADIPFRSYRNIANLETKKILEKINKGTNINMTKESWEDIIINSRSKFEKNSDWHLIIRTLFEKVNNNLQARRDFLHALEKLETKNRDAANELRDYLRTAKLIDIVK